VRVGTIGISALLIVGSGGLCNSQVGSQPAAEIFPMRTGTYWIYRGDVAWQGTGEGARVHRSRLDWKMEIVDGVQRGRYKAALIIGHPRNLTWPEKEQKRGCDILIAVDGKRFYLIQCEPSASRQKLLVDESKLRAMIGEENLIFKLPLREGEIFGGDPERGVKDGMYAWTVEAIRQRRPDGIRGALNIRPWTEYDLIYRTNPDHQVANYVPGIGLTTYMYSHHGTVSEVDVKLVEFQPPGGK
jgi:hypothetical protein